MGESIEERLSDIERGITMIRLQLQLVTEIQKTLFKPQFLVGLNHELSSLKLTIESQYSGMFGGVTVCGLGVAFISLGTQYDSLLFGITGIVIICLSIVWLGRLIRYNRRARREAEQAKRKFEESKKELEEFLKKIENLAKQTEELA
ncbi:MAG: hypothetical protein ISS52_06230 [Dehalococcoidia bacterium]|nr:hypothetical protein [Dehalococcoidia bacterium]